MKRREAILKFAIGTGTLLIAPNTFISCAEEESPVPGEKGNNNNNNSNKVEIDLSDSKYSSLNNAGEFVIVSGIIIVNAGNDKIVAFSSTCTHQGCTISYNPSIKNFPCPCHGSVFSINGSVLNGPASKSLPQFSVTRDENLLIISP